MFLILDMTNIHDFLIIIQSDVAFIRKKDIVSEIFDSEKSRLSKLQSL